MICRDSMWNDFQRVLLLLMLALGVAVSGRAVAASNEAALLQEKIAALKTLPNASFEWQLLALDIAAALKELPPSKAREAAARAFKPQVEAFVRQDVRAVAEQRIRAATEIWVQRIGKALAGEGLEMKTRAHEENGAWIASVDFPGMRESLAKMLSTDTDLANSAQLSGFDRLDFVDSTTGRSCQYPLGGSERVRMLLLREAAADWGFEQF